MTEFWQLASPVPGQSERAARAAQDLGWDGLSFTDTQCLSGDIYSAMSLAAKATTTLKVGSAVTNPVTRHPAVTASAIATVQVESNGRAVLGIGRGDSSLGHIGQKPAPVSLFERYVEQLQGYLRGDPVELDDGTSRIEWITATGQPKVPVEVASTGPRVIAMAGRFADQITFAVGADPQRIAQGMVDARQAAESVGRDPDELSFGAYINIACDDDVQRAVDIVRGCAGAFAHFSGMSAAASNGLQDASVFKKIGANYDMANHGSGGAAHMAEVSDGFLRRFAVAGPTALCVDRLGELIDQGLDRLVLSMGSKDSNMEHAMASIERISKEVITQFR